MSCNSNFKQTSIPFLTKSGTPMSYFTLSEDDTHTKVTGAECLAPAEQSDNIYPQRWFVDEESGLVVRLPRNAKSEELARDNMRFFWAEAKRQERRCACIARGSKRCPVKCYNCRMSDYCNSTHKETDGLKCAKKCEICTLSQRGLDSDETLGSIHAIDKKLEENAEQRNVLVGLMTKGYLEPAVYNKSNNELLQEAERLRRQKESVTRFLNNDFQNLSEVSALLQYATKASMLKGFDGDIFKRFVKRIIVYSRLEIGFEFKCGITLKERLVR